MSSSESSKALYNKNLRHFGKWFPQYVPQLAEADKPQDRLVQVARDGSSTLIQLLPDGQVALHSTYNPKREAERWAEGVGTNWDVLILFGASLGYHLEAIAKAYPDKEVILVENSFGNLKLALGCVDFSGLLPLMRVIVSNDPNIAAREASTILLKNIHKNVVIKALPGYDRAYPDYWTFFLRGVNDQIVLFKSNLGANLSFGSLWLSNFRLNFLKYLEAPGVNLLFNGFKDVPIIIVASGPSLEKNIHSLHTVRNRAFILGVGSAIGPLVKNGVIPDLLISYDPIEANYNHFADIPTEKIRLAFASSIYYKIVSTYQGPTFSFSIDRFSRYFENQIGRVKSSLVSGGTVAVLGLDLAIKMGGNPIVFIGQDLAFTDLISHASGNKNLHTVSESDQGIFKAPGVNGEVYTNNSFWAMKLQLEGMIKQNGSTCKVIDATEGGLLIEGTEIMPLQEVISTFCIHTYPFAEMLDERLAFHQPLTIADKAILNRLLDDFAEEASFIRKCTGEAQQELNRLSLNLPTQAQFNKSLKKIKLLERDILESDLYVNLIVPLAGQQLKILSKNAETRIGESASLESRVASIVNGYESWFLMVGQAVDHVDKDFLTKLKQDLVHFA